MRPKTSVRPMPSRLYVAPSSSPFSRCWSSWSKRSRSWPALLLHERGKRDLAVLDLDDEDARLGLAALLAGRAVLLELDRPVEPHQVHLPERLLHRLGVGLAGHPNALDRGEDAVVTAEALGQALEGMTALGPLVHERLRELAVRHRLGEPGQEEQDVVGALRGRAGLLDQLAGRRAAAGGDHLAGEPLLLRLLQHQGDLLHAGGEEQ